jgi:stage II sporulation protein D
MSQEGALGMAEHGYSYQQILAHYYTDTTLGSTSGKQKVRVLLGSGKVLTIGLERYVRGVVGAEMSPSWPMAALEAQAVASRTYVLTDRAGGAKFDVYSDTRSQMYLGKAAETAQTDAAVAATAGQIVSYHSAPAITYFFASSGGLTENVANAFPGAEQQPWLRGVGDPYDQGPLHRWTITMTMASAARRLAGLFHGRLQGIEVLKRGFSPRIVTALVRGSRGATEVSGAELEARLGLYSTWAYFSVASGGKSHAEPDRSHYRLPAGSEATLTERAPTELTSQAHTPAPASTPEGGAEATAAAIDGGAVSG